MEVDGRNACGERLLYGQPTSPNPLIHRDDFSRQALRHGNFNSLLQVAYYYLTSYTLVDLDLMTLPLPAYLTDYLQVHMLGMWYRFVIFVVQKARFRQLCRSECGTDPSALS